LKKVLVTGGAGYIGSVLVRLLLNNGFKVRVLDNLTYGGESITECLNDLEFDFLKGDVRNIADIDKALHGIDYVVHLAAIVGDPACALQPVLANAVNLVATKKLYDLSNKQGVTKFIFASTCSNYGKMKNHEVFVNEKSELAPVSLYAETKVAVENYLLTQSKENICKPTCLRFSTVYGLSPRLRFDLTVNEFTREIAMGRELVVFGEQFWRPYCHVLDLSRSVLSVLISDEEKVGFEVFNVGDTNENYQKQMIVNEILKQIPEGKVKYIQRTEDPRDYRVNFEKIKDQLNFNITYRVSDGIAQIRKILTDGFLNDPYDGKYKNT
jgi:nucleoside-diphosphate-sugar epimerase